MNSVNFKNVKSFTRGFLFAVFYFAQVKVHAIEKPSLLKLPPKQSEVHSNDAEILQALKKAVQPVEPTREIVILNTESGFVPDKVRVKKGEAYKVYIVNLNMKEKNVSFLMDSFTQSHNTVYGLMKTFNIQPQVEGVFSYQCPETGIQGEMVVVKEEEKRKLATEE